jgi:hypothetical protein
MRNKDSEKSKTKARPWLIALGAVITVLPVIIAILLTPPGGNPLSECGTCEGSGGGAAIWFTLFTSPIGTVIFVLGFGSERAKRIGLKLLKLTVLYPLYLLINSVIREMSKKK